MPEAMDVILYQTAAGDAYEAMLAATAPLHRAFCAANDIRYESYVGVRRGYHPWQATFNRIPMVHDLIADGFRGWFLYLDADAIVRDPRFPIRDYLAERSDHALIAAAGGVERWQVNIGVLFLNLGHPLGIETAQRWHDAMHGAVTDDRLRDAVAPWQPLADGNPFPDDQHLLQMTLRNDPRLEASLLLEDHALINYHEGRFIGQHLRSFGSHGERLASIRAEADAIARDFGVAA